MNVFVKNFINGAVSLAALYAVGKIAYQAGREIAMAECRYEQLQQAMEKAVEDGEPNDDEASVVPEKKKSLWRSILGIRKSFSEGGAGAITDVVTNPEKHKFEAVIKGREIHVNVKPKNA